MDIEKGKHYLMPVSQGIIPGQTLAKYRDVTTITALYLSDLLVGESRVLE